MLLLTAKTRLQNDLLCVERDVKLYSQTFKCWLEQLDLKERLDDTIGIQDQFLINQSN